MDLNRLFFRALFIGTGMIGGYLTLSACGDLWVWARLSGKTAAKVVRWEIEERGSRYAAWADYDYFVGEKRFTGRARLSGAPLISEGAALSRIKERGRSGWTAHYAPSKPTLSSLERDFPKGNCIRAALSLGVLIYFYMLRKKLRSI